MDPELTIVLLGNTGVGKSASGNTILGQLVFPSKASFKPVTTEIREEKGQVFGKQVQVIDTPGILESEEQIKKVCRDLLTSSRPHLFLLVLSVKQFGVEDQKSVETAIELLETDNLQNSFLLFTGGDALKDMSLDEFIREGGKGSLQNVVKKFEGKHHLFNNRHGGQEQAEELLQKFHQRDVLIHPVYQERIIILIGRPGVGKSSSGNTILEFKKFRSGCDFGLVSTETVSESAEVEGRWITVVDTPGFTDEVLTPELLYLKIREILKVASPGAHAFVIVVGIGQIFTADRKLFELLLKVFGRDASQYTMVLFTHGDDLRGQSIDDLIQSSSCMSDLISMCGGRFCLFENKKRGSRRQARDFLRRIDEMVEANRGEHCTFEMFKMAETYIREVRHLSDESAGRHLSDESAGRHLSDESAGRHLSDESAGKHLSDESAGRHLSDESVGRHLSDESAGRHLSDESAGGRLISEV